VTGQRTWISTCRARTMTAYAPINDAIARDLAVQIGYVPLEETRRIRIAFPRARLALGRSSQEEATCRRR
jgi:hypothetical protein